jgi:hypothetical protein
LLAQQQLARQKTSAKKHNANDQVDAPLFEKIPKREPVQFRPIRKVVVHRRFNQSLRVAVRRKLVHMHEQRNRVATRKFLHPTDDEFFRVIIEVLLLEGRRIH